LNRERHRDRTLARSRRPIMSSPALSRREIKHSISERFYVVGVSEHYAVGRSQDHSAPACGRPPWPLHVAESCVSARMNNGYGQGFFASTSEPRRPRRSFGTLRARPGCGSGSVVLTQRNRSHRRRRIAPPRAASPPTWLRRKALDGGRARRVHSRHPLVA
jgi:hypothetical protein